MRRTRVSLILVLLVVVSPALFSQLPSPDSVYQHAVRLAHEFIIVDGHIDLPSRLHEKWEDIVDSTAGDFDYPRAVRGGLSAPFMAAYIPPEDEEKGTAFADGESLIDVIRRMAATWPDKFAVALSTHDVRTNSARGIISLCIGLENGAPLQGKLQNIEYFHARGVRYITLCHSKDNHICDSSGDTTHTWHGLSPFGRQVVAEMNRVGIMIDVSHISDDSFFQVVALSKAPVIASHSSCRSYTPTLLRNMTDDMIRAMGKNGGVIMVNFGSEFVNDRFSKWEQQRLEAVHAYLQEHHTTYRDSLTRQFARQWRQEHPPAYADVREVAANIDHIAKLIGVDHVGFGSDFEGLGDQLPTGLKDVSMYPNLIEQLLRMGYSDADVKKICGENLLRVWDEAEAIASREQQTD